jgi:hypothetical protein
VCRNHTPEGHIHTHTCQFVRDVITLVRVVITLVSVIITLVSVIITLIRSRNHRRECRNHIRACQKLQCVWIIHCACINHTRACRYHTRECNIQTYTCQNYSRVSGNHTLRVKTHSANENRTLRFKFNLVRVEITLCV